MTLSLIDLAKYAAGSAARVSKTPLQDLSIEEARKVVNIVDNKKVKKEDEVAVTLQFGRRKLTLDAISSGATRLNVPKSNEVAVSASLATAVVNGEFDEAIKQAQEAITAAKLTASTKVDETTETDTITEPETVVTPEEKEALTEDTAETPVESSDEPNIDGLDLSSI